MAHYRKPLAAAVAVNTAIFVVEAIAGFQAQSLSLLMDSVHNLSDELALILIYLAFILPQGISRNLLRSANIFNSVGLLAVSALLLWQSIERLLHPKPVLAMLQSSSVSQPQPRTGASPVFSGRPAAIMQRYVWPTSTTSATSTFARAGARWPAGKRQRSIIF